MDAMPWQITAVELRRLIDGGTRVNLIDVREPYDYDFCHLNGSRLVPLAQIPNSLTKLARPKSLSSTVIPGTEAEWQTIYSVQGLRKRRT